MHFKTRFGTCANDAGLHLYFWLGIAAWYPTEVSVFPQRTVTDVWAAVEMVSGVPETVEVAGGPSGSA